MHVHQNAILFLMYAAMSAASSNPLGLDYSARLGGSLSGVFTGVDGAGSVYVLQNAQTGELTPTKVLGATITSSSYVTKISADGTKVVYLTMLGFVANTMAVDSGGSVYLGTANLVAKLDPSGSSFVYMTPITPDCLVTAVAVDNSGDLFVTGRTTFQPLATTSNAFQTVSNSLPGHAFVVKLNAAGTGFDYATYLAGSDSDVGWAIAVNSAGEASVAGQSSSPDFPITPSAYDSIPSISESLSVPFLTGLTADGSSLVYSTFTGGSSYSPVAVAITPQGRAAVYLRGETGSTLMEVNPQGTALEFSRVFPAATIASAGLVADAVGNVYATGSTTVASLAIHNSIATCSSASVYLTVLDPSGNLVQSTYLASVGIGSQVGDAVALGPNGGVFVAGTADTSFAPTRQISGTSGGSLFLVRLSATSPSQVLGLACVGNAGSFAAGSVAPGEIVSLFGQGLGPAQGVTPIVSIQSSFPTQLADVSVTFDGTPAPLLYVQDGQINTVVPWRLAAGATTNICVSYAGVPTNCVIQNVSTAAPGVFTSDGVYAAAVNQDGTINSAANPAAQASIVSNFATGLGQVSPMPTDGAITIPPLGANVLPTEVGLFAGGIVPFIVPIQPQFAGPAPFELAGVSQINVAASAGFLFLTTGQDFNNPTARSTVFRIHVIGQ